MAIACDECGAVLDSNNPDCVSDRLEFSAGNYTFQVIVARGNTWNNGSLCKKCLKKLILRALN